MTVEEIEALAAGAVSRALEGSLGAREARRLARVALVGRALASGVVGIPPAVLAGVLAGLQNDDDRAVHDPLLMALDAWRWQSEEWWGPDVCPVTPMRMPRSQLRQALKVARRAAPEGAVSAAAEPVLSLDLEWDRWLRHVWNREQWEARQGRRQRVLGGLAGWLWSDDQKRRTKFIARLHSEAEQALFSVELVKLDQWPTGNGCGDGPPPRP